VILVLNEGKTKMKKLMKIGAAALIASLAAGCATVTYSAPGRLDNVSVKGIEGRKAGQAVLIDTTGFYLFWTIPLVSGDLRWDDKRQSSKGGTLLFRDQVGVDELQSALLKIAESRNCDLADVSFYDSDGFYADASWGGLVGMCFGSSQMSVSAILVPHESIAK
jgi:hypothetical protein